MKILTVAIPVYNTEKYIKRCLDSLLITSIVEDLEIIAVNDGSSDESLQILNQYKTLYPNTIIVIDKPNGGHGSTINAAIEIANGKFFRVLDSDDWVNSKDFVSFIQFLKKEDSDLIITNYSKEYVYNGYTETISWNKLKENTQYYIDKINLEILNKDYFVMANSTYKTQLLKDANLHLLEKTFYVDMQYNVIPISKLQTFKYINLDIYRYFIGRPDQSMNLNNFIKNRSNHEKVMKFLIDYYLSTQKNLSENKQLYIEQILFYMLNTHYYIYCVYPSKGSKELYAEIKNFDCYLKEQSTFIYNKLNQIGQIRYARKSKFLFVKTNPNRFSKLVTFIGNIKIRK